jgi:molybdopterin converting factor small subunit
MSVREMLGWQHKALEFDGETLSEFLKVVSTKHGKTLYDLFVRSDGTMGTDYNVWLNCRPVKQEFSLDIPLRSGDRVIAMPAVRFARGG